MIILNNLDYILYCGLLTITGAFLNRWRGGWQIDWLKIDNHGIKRLIVCFIPTISLLLPFKDMIEWWLWIVSYLSFLIIGILPGWGSWFFVGRAKDSWKHNKDAIWVEYITYWVYGPKWIPKTHNLTIPEYFNLKARFNLIDSPTGKVRPLDWRIKMEKFGMSIRGLGISIPPVIILISYFYYFYDVIFYQSILLLPIGYLMGWCYNIGHEINTKKFPNWLSSSTNIGEFLTGGLIFGFLINSISVLTYYLIK